MRQEAWLIVGKEVSGNNVKKYCFLSSNGNRQWIQHCYTASFIRKHEVLNAKVNGELIIK